MHLAPRSCGCTIDPMPLWHRCRALVPATLSGRSVSPEAARWTPCSGAARPCHGSVLQFGAPKPPASANSRGSTSKAGPTPANVWVCARSCAQGATGTTAGLCQANAWLNGMAAMAQPSSRAPRKSGQYALRAGQVSRAETIALLDYGMPQNRPAGNREHGKAVWKEGTSTIQYWLSADGS